MSNPGTKSAADSWRAWPSEKGNPMNTPTAAAPRGAASVAASPDVLRSGE